MLATRWQRLGTVWPEMSRLQEQMEQWLGRLGMNDPRRSAQSVYPPLNAWEDDNNLYVEAQLPELELSDLEIVVNGDNQLSIKGERRATRARKRHVASSGARPWQLFADGRVAAVRGQRQGHGRIQARCVDHYVAQAEGSQGSTDRGHSRLTPTFRTHLSTKWRCKPCHKP